MGTNLKKPIHRALREEFDNRGFDYSAIGYNINRKIKLIGKKIMLEVGPQSKTKLIKQELLIS